MSNINLYRNKENGMLYTLEHLVHDIKHLNGNAFRGIYPKVYCNHVELTPYTFENCQNNDEAYEPEKYIKDNFEIIAEIY